MKHCLVATIDSSVQLFAVKLFVRSVFHVIQKYMYKVMYCNNEFGGSF